ncbi:cracdl [Pungitius sinensis]
MLAMEFFSGDTEGSTDDIPGRKKFKLKSLKNRFFGRSKRGVEEGDAKLSQSASDITAEKGPESEEDLACSQGMMGSRALSADSIFLADQVLTDAEPATVLSQENVHGKIKALQMKLQQQKMHLGPPPLVLPARRAEDLGSRSEDEGPAHGLSEIPEALSKTRSKPPSRPLSPLPNPAPIKSVPLSPSHPLPPSVSSNSSSTAVELTDFNSPVQFTPCLDTSAARHRMSVRPKNQRARPKKTPTANYSNEPDIHTLNNINCPASAREEEQQVWIEEELILEKEQGEAVVVKSQHLPSKPPEVAPISSEEPYKLSVQTVSEQDQALLGRVSSAPSQILRVKPHQPAVVRPSDRPHSSFIQSEPKDNKDRDSEMQAMSLDKRKPPNKVGMAVTSCDQLSSNFGSSPVHQHVQGEKESTRGLTRPAPGSGSFHISMTAAKNRDAERPRSGSFVGVLEHIEARQKAEDQQSSSTREKEELRGGPFAVGRLRQAPAPHKISAPWDRKDSLKHVEPVTPSQNVTTDTSAASVEQLESNQEVVEEAVEAQEVEENEGKPVFGVKLRSTSLSMRLRSDSSPNHRTKLPVYEEQCDQLKRPEMGDLESKDSIPSGYSLPAKHNKLPTDNPHTMATEVQTTSSNLKKESSVQELQPAPQTTSSEVSWMSIAMEKTRTLQQLFTNRFPRDFTGVQTAARPQAQVQTETPTGGQEQTQTVKLQQSTTTIEGANQSRTDAVKAETVPSGSQTKAVKPSPALAVQQKTPPLQSREPQTLKPTGEKAFFLEKRSEWTTPPGIKGVDSKKVEIEEQISGESPAKPLNKDIKPVGRQGVKLAESGPTKVPERPREDKWLRKNAAPSSSPSSSPTRPSALQSATDSGQPSWMELAKRKSMAWSDKSMD